MKTIRIHGVRSMCRLLLAICAVLCLPVLPSQAETRADLPTQYGGGAFSLDGSSLAVGTAVGQITLYNPKTGDVIDQVRRTDDRLPEHIAWRPDGKRLASGGPFFASFAKDKKSNSRN